jgi:hypothetical protein
MWSWSKSMYVHKVLARKWVLFGILLCGCGAQRAQSLSYLGGPTARRLYKGGGGAGGQGWMDELP